MERDLLDDLEGPESLDDLDDLFPEDPAADELERLRATLEARDASDRDNLERYRRALIASDPALTAGLLGGDTFDEVEASYTAARELAARVRDGAVPPQTVPPGAPGRSAGPPASSFDKIRRGLASLP